MSGINIPSYLLGAIIFLIGQTATAIWWASGISNDVEELKRDRDDIRMMVDHLDVLTYRIENLEQTINRAFGKEMR
jgi:phosphoribosylaminoimidazole carboxylase (NCAIR synthetase)